MSAPLGCTRGTRGEFRSWQQEQARLILNPCSELWKRKAHTEALRLTELCKDTDEWERAWGTVPDNATPQEIYNILARINHELIMTGRLERAAMAAE